MKSVMIHISIVYLVGVVDVTTFLYKLGQTLLWTKLEHLTKKNAGSTILAPNTYDAGHQDKTCQGMYSNYDII